LPEGGPSLSVFAADLVTEGTVAQKLQLLLEKGVSDD
jgi:hypothetical protein